MLRETLRAHWPRTDRRRNDHTGSLSLDPADILLPGMGEALRSERPETWPHPRRTSLRLRSPIGATDRCCARWLDPRHTPPTPHRPATWSLLPPSFALLGPRRRSRRRARRSQAVSDRAASNPLPAGRPTPRNRIPAEGPPPPQNRAPREQNEPRIAGNRPPSRHAPKGPSAWASSEPMPMSRAWT